MLFVDFFVVLLLDDADDAIESADFLFLLVYFLAERVHYLGLIKHYPIFIGDLVQISKIERSHHIAVEHLFVALLEAILVGNGTELQISNYLPLKLYLVCLQQL